MNQTVDDYSVGRYSLTNLLNTSSVSNCYANGEEHKIQLLMNDYPIVRCLL